MKSILRINGTETIVENVAPNSKAFSEKASETLREIFGEDKNFLLSPLPRFGMKENTDTYNSGVLSGNIEGECCVAVSVVEEYGENPVSTIPAFIVFRK